MMMKMMPMVVTMMMLMSMTRMIPKAPFPAQAGGSEALGWLGSSEHFHRYHRDHPHVHHRRHRHANSCHQRRLVSDYTKFGQVENTF